MLTQTSNNTDGKEFIRGSSEVPLSPMGERQAKDIGRKLAGQIDHIHSSTMGRAKATARAIVDTNPDATKHATDQLHPWRLGGHEGKPVEDVLPDMLDRIKNRPDEPAPQGRGPLSVADGESFNQFKNRSLNHMKQIIGDMKPGEKTAVTTHYRNIRVMESWLKNGAPANNDIDTDEMLKKGDSEPGDIFYLNPRTKSLDKVDNAVEPGMYMIRHGATAWNMEDKSKAS